MQWSGEPDPYDPAGSRRPRDVDGFALIGIAPEEIVELATLFKSGEREALCELLRERAGHPWARTLEEIWQEDEVEARRRGLFDLVWHRRARQVDPMVHVPAFSGFDVLLAAARRMAPDLHALLSRLNGIDPDNERTREGPEWWRAWHSASASRPGGWLEVDEVDLVSQLWGRLATVEVEKSCLSLLGETFTHPGCWGLLSDLGGFFAQCAVEKRAVVAELDRVGAPE